MNVATVLHWLGTQVAALVTTVKDIADNTPQPARQTAISIVVLIFIGWAVYKLAKKKGK